MTHRLLLLLALAAASPSFADNTADESDIAFSLGNLHYAKRDYERALAQYFLSYRLVPNRNVLFNIARCYEAIDKLDEAYRYYHDLSVDPGLSEEDRRDVHSALARLAPKVALVSITTTPPGAELFIDREDLGSRGQTPQTIAVSPGAHTVLVKLAGHRAASGKVTAVKGRDAKQELSLERIVGRVTVRGTPQGAVIRESAEGPELGRLPATLAFTPGQRLLVVQAPGHLPSQLLVNVTPDSAVELKVQLSEKPKPTGKVVVTANRDNAVVRVDGKNSGFTPVVLTLVEGPHTIEVTTDEVTPLVEEVTVVADSERRLAAELRYAPPQVKAASQTQLTIDQAPASVTIITREELRAFGHQTLADALSAVRGLFFTDDRVYTYIGLRGFSPAGDLNTRILILYDGHPMNDVWAGQGYAALDLDVDLSEVDHVEVVRGPASILYGTGAFFGVINVVPRERLPSGHGADGVVGVGGQGGVKARVTGSMGDERRSLLVSAAGFKSSGAELTDLGTLGVVQGLDGERSLGASMRGHFDDFSFNAKVNQRRKDIPTVPLGSDMGVPGTNYMDARGFAELRWTHDFGALTLNARASYDGTRYEGQFATHGTEGAIALSRENGGADWMGAGLRAGLKLFEGNTLSFTVDAQQQFAYQQPVDMPVDRHSRTLISATLIDEWQLGSRLFLQAGVRADKYFDLPELAISPRLALVAHPYATGVTKVVAGQAFRAPTVYEVYFNDNNITQRAPTTPPRPELITTFEVEHSHDLTREFRVTAGAYYNLIDRLVVLFTDDLPKPACTGTGEPIQCTVYGNSSRQLTALGAEGQLRWQPGRFTLVDATYSFVMLGDAAKAEASAYPVHTASARAIVPLREGVARLSGQLTWQSARKDPEGASLGESLLLNFGLSGEYGAVRYFAGVKNLLDARYLLPVASEAGVPVVPQYGRTFWLELAAGF